MGPVRSLWVSPPPPRGICDQSLRRWLHVRALDPAVDLGLVGGNPVIDFLTPGLGTLNTYGFSSCFSSAASCAPAMPVPIPVTRFQSCCISGGISCRIVLLRVSCCVPFRWLKRSLVRAFSRLRFLMIFTRFQWSSAPSAAFSRFPGIFHLMFCIPLICPITPACSALHSDAILFSASHCFPVFPVYLVHSVFRGRL